MTAIAYAKVTDRVYGMRDPAEDNGVLNDLEEFVGAGGEADGIDPKRSFARSARQSPEPA